MGDVTWSLGPFAAAVLGAAFAVWSGCTRTSGWLGAQKKACRNRISRRCAQEAKDRVKTPGGSRVKSNGRDPALLSQELAALNGALLSVVKQRKGMTIFKHVIGSVVAPATWRLRASFGR